MTYKSEYPANFNPITFDAEKCLGCNRCVNVCQVDVFLPKTEETSTPVVQYPEECWYCGCCVMVCPSDGAIDLRHPLMNQVSWVDKKKLMNK
ncbi:ferredoxin family protein [Acidaminobacter sp. JC074]|uniref:4Fe-4S dicluster domain-containing protein n=1 Tax=Acidaminobacter sp. JC074 TaxID=2530199 RepID=UPI001F0E1DA9|nr:ferredoxin family protein [Acidaminobacter sp. JC074]MCH4886315.1 ferredoxin family protein [Acidaminobacter sp. JC074]